MNAVAPVKKSIFWIIFFVVFIDLIGFGIVFPLLPLYAREYHLTEFQIGLVLGIYSLMQFIFAPILGRLSDKIGRRPVLFVSILGTSLSFFMLAWSHNFWWFFIARALDGIAGSNLATAQAYIADISPKEQRTRNLGMWIGAAFGLGFAFGPFLGALFSLMGNAILPGFGGGFPFLMAGILALINAGFAYFMLPESLPLRDGQHLVGRRTASLGQLKNQLLHPVGILIVVNAIVILAFSQMESTFTWLSHDVYQIKTLGIYALFGYLGVVMSVVQGGLVRRLAPKMGDRNMALMGCALMTVSLATIALFHHWIALLVLAGVLAAGESFSNPALISSISKASHESVQGETMGNTQSLASLSRFLGPAMAGYFYQHHGPASPYFISAILMLFAIGLCIKGFQRIVFTPHEPVSV